MSSYKVTESNGKITYLEADDIKVDMNGFYAIKSEAVTGDRIIAVYPAGTTVVMIEATSLVGVIEAVKDSAEEFLASWNPDYTDGERGLIAKVLRERMAAADSFCRPGKPRNSNS